MSLGTDGQILVGDGVEWQLLCFLAPRSEPCPTSVPVGRQSGVGKKSQLGSASPNICPASCKASVSPRLSFLIYQMELLIFVCKEW